MLGLSKTICLTKLEREGSLWLEKAYFLVDLMHGIDTAHADYSSVTSESQSPPPE